MFLAWVFLLITLVSVGGLAEAKTFVVGIVCLSATQEPAVTGFENALNELVTHDSEMTVTYLYIGPVSDAAAEVARLLSAGVDCLLGVGTGATQAAQKATLGTETPVVFAFMSDPVASGTVQDLVHPGSNVTGVKAGGSVGKAIEWLLQAAPAVKRLYVPHWPSDSGAVQGMAELVPAAATLGVELIVREATTTQELLTALDETPTDADALFLLGSAPMNAQVDAYVQTSIAHRIPLVTPSPLVNRGVLLTYGHDYRRDGEQAARLVHLIIHGALPADTPVEQADFFLGINLQTAAAIGLVISDDVLDQADFIVR